MANSDKLFQGLTIVNTVWLTGLTLFQWKTNAALRAQLEEQSIMLNDLSKKLAALGDKTGQIPDLIEAVKELDKSVLDIERTIQDFPIAEDINCAIDQVESLLKDLKSHGITVKEVECCEESPPPPPRRGRSRPVAKETKSRAPPVVEESDFDAASVVAEMRKVGGRNERPRARRR